MSAELDTLRTFRLRARIRSIRRPKDEFTFSPDEWQQIEDLSEDCHICHRPKDGVGALFCSYPHPLVEE